MITVLGAGSWGTALAIQLARSRPVRLWGRDTARITAMQAARENTAYLPGSRFPDALAVEPDLGRALDGAATVLLVVPSHAFREILVALAGEAAPGVRVAYAVKGFEPGSGKLPHAVVDEVFGDCSRAVVSGPTFAREVADGLPGAIVVGSSDTAFASELVTALHCGPFRAYRTDDVIGVEVGGAVKNVIAIATGLSDGLGFGANARAALITRGLTEIVRLGTVLGGKRETFLGLAGVGDLVLTCTDDQSRNRRFGLALARGESVDDAQRGIGQVVEGFVAAREVMRLAQQHGIEMPIAEQVHQVLYQRVTARAAFETLMAREPRVE